MPASVQMTALRVHIRAPPFAQQNTVPFRSFGEHQEPWANLADVRTAHEGRELHRAWPAAARSRGHTSYFEHPFADVLHREELSQAMDAADNCMC